MIRTGRKKEWSILLFVASLVALMPPVIALFDFPDRVAGIPLSYLYLFAVWAGMIGLTAFGAKPGADKTVGPPEAGGRKIGAHPRQGKQ